MRETGVAIVAVATWMLSLAVVVSGPYAATGGETGGPRWRPSYKIKPHETDRFTAADVVGPDGIVYPDWRYAGIPGGIPDLPDTVTVERFGGKKGDLTRAVALVGLVGEQRPDPGQVAALYEGAEAAGQHSLHLLGGTRREVALRHASGHQVVGGVEVVERRRRPARARDLRVVADRQGPLTGVDLDVVADTADGRAVLLAAGLVVGVITEIPGIWDFFTYTFNFDWMADVPMTSFKYMWVYLAYFVIMVVRPRGLFGWKH